MHPVERLTVGFVLVGLLAGCINRPGEASLSDAGCKPQTQEWGENCPRLLLKDYYLNFENVRLELTNDSRLALSFDLHAWRNAAVTLLAIEGYGGFQNGTNQSLDFTETAVPLDIGAGTRKSFTVLTLSSVFLNQSEIFYGVKMKYKDALEPRFEHGLVAFSRCYTVDGRELRFVPTIEGPRGETVDCLSKNYFSRGEVSRVTVLIHDYQASKHAFPGAEITSFWHNVLASYVPGT